MERKHIHSFCLSHEATQQSGQHGPKLGLGTGGWHRPGSHVHGETWGGCRASGRRSRSGSLKMTGFQKGNAGPGAAGEAGQLPFTVESCGPPPKCAHNHFPVLSTLHGNQPDRPKTEQRFRFWLSNPNGQSHLLSSASYAGASSLMAGPKSARPPSPPSK